VKQLVNQTHDVVSRTNKTTKLKISTFCHPRRINAIKQTVPFSNHPPRCARQQSSMYNFNRTGY
jgi:hypothetical protein